MTETPKKKRPKQEPRGVTKGGYFAPEWVARLARNQRLSSPEYAKGLGDARVMVIGAGSVGSYMADKIMRAGVGGLTVIDPDKVETHNLTRSVYRADDIGKPKVTALAGILKAVNPWVQIKTEAARLEDIAKASLKSHVEANDVIICAADDKLTQARVNKIAVHYKKPLIVVGLYAGAKGGEVALIVPGVTPCLECTLAGRQLDVSRSDDLEVETDYGTGRLKPTVGLGCDIHFVTNAAAKLTLSLLTAMTNGIDGDNATGDAAELVQGALQRGENLVILGMTPDFWFMPQAMGNAKGQYAFQSVWLKTASDPACPNCGTEPSAENPIDAMQATPSIDSLAGGQNNGRQS